MSGAAHTPGPWQAVQDTYRDRQHRREAVAKWVDTREADDLWAVFAPDGSSCLVGGETDARLVAAAPELLQALDDISMLASYALEENTLARVDALMAIHKAAHAAIAKATAQPAPVPR